MLYTSSLKHMVIYNNKRMRFPIIKGGDIRRGSLIFMASRHDVQSSIRIINNKQVTHQYYGGYYIDRLYKGYVNTRMVIRRFNDLQKETYPIVASKTNLNKMYRFIHQYRGYNTFYDLFKHSDIFFDNINVVGNKKLGAFIKYFNGVFTKPELASYVHKTLYINIGEWIDGDKFNIQDFKLFTMDNFFEVFYNVLKYDINQLKAFGIDDIILQYQKKIIRIIVAEATPDTASQLVQLIRKMHVTPDAPDEAADDIAGVPVLDNPNKYLNDIPENEQAPVEEKPASTAKTISTASIMGSPTNDELYRWGKETIKNATQADNRLSVGKAVDDFKSQAQKAEKEKLPENKPIASSNRSEPRTNIFDDTPAPVIPKTSDGIAIRRKIQFVTNPIEEKIMRNIINSKVKSFTGESGEDYLPQEVLEKLDNIVDSNPGKSEAEVEAEISKDKEMLMAIADYSLSKSTGRTSASIKRDMELRKKQMEINVSGRSYKDIVAKQEKNRIEPKKIGSIKLSDAHPMTNLKLPNFDKEYNDKLYEHDFISALASLSDENKDIQVFITKIDRIDSSDFFTKKETWTVHLEDNLRRRHTLKVDMPIIIDDTFLYISGNKKVILNQLMLKPITKTGPNTVQICTNYNKIFVTRTDSKASPKTTRLIKLLSDEGALTRYKISKLNGDSSLVNANFRTTIEYDELAKNFIFIKFRDKSGKIIIIYLNQEYLVESPEFGDIVGSLKLAQNHLIIGFHDDVPLILDTDSNTIVGSEIDFVDYIIGALAETYPDIEKELSQITSGKKFMYSRATIMGKKVPLILLLSYSEGLTTVLRKANIKFKFSDKRPVINKLKEGVVKFADGYLIYELYPMRNSLLLNAFNEIPTESYNYSEFDSKEIYLDIFDIMFNMRNIANAFDNFYRSAIDNITKEVLEDLSYPTKYVDVLLFANALLEDSSFIPENNMNNYRLRSNEMINAIFYKQLHIAYSRYVMNHKQKRASISMPQDIVIKELLTSTIIEDYSQLNPITEAERTRAVGYKGPSGLNLEDAYTLEKRAYTKSMMGIMAISSPPTGSVGITRQLPLDCNVVNARGYLSIENEDDLNAANILSPSELIVTLGTNHDDAPRIGMSSIQNRHVVAIEDSDPVLIGNGIEKVLPHVLSNDFCFKAKENGVVERIDEETNLVILKYDNDTFDCIDISAKIAKNGNGGFYISNQLNATLKEKSKFKKGDILAVNDNYFKEDMDGDISLTQTAMFKVAFATADFTFEDSSMLTENASKRLTTQVSMPKDVVLGKDANVSFMAKKGQQIKTGDPLIIFERSHDEDDVNKFLSQVGDDLKEDILELGKSTIRSKYSGIVEDIEIYRTVEISDLSASLQKIVKSYEADIKKLKKVLDQYNIPNNTDIMLRPTEKVEAKYGKVMGVDVGEGIYIKFHVKYRDRNKVGDKICYHTALKSVPSEICEKGKEPFSEFRPDEEISLFMSQLGFTARMTTSVLSVGFNNKMLIELKRACKDIYES